MTRLYILTTSIMSPCLGLEFFSQLWSFQTNQHLCLAFSMSLIQKQYCLRIIVWWPKSSELGMTGRGLSKLGVLKNKRKEVLIQANKLRTQDTPIGWVRTTPCCCSLLDAVPLIIFSVQREQWRIGEEPTLGPPTRAQTWFYVLDSPCNRKGIPMCLEW